MAAEDIANGTALEEQSGPASYYRLFAAAINTNGNLVYVDQQSDNGPFAKNFTQLTNYTYDKGPIAASTTQDGYVSVLAQQTGTQHPIYIAENTCDSGDRFDNPVDLGLPPSVAAFGNLVLISGLNGLDNVFGTASTTDNAIWWKYKNPYTTTTETITVTPPGTDKPVEVQVTVPVPPKEPWSDWTQIPGSLASLTATNNADGRIILGGVNSGQIPYINIQTSDDPSKPEGWLGWQDLSGSVGEIEQLVVAISGNSLVYIFGKVGTNIYMRAQTEVSGKDFTEWMLFAAFEDTVESFAVGVGGNDGLYLAAQAGSAPGSRIYGSFQFGDLLEFWTEPSVIAFAQGAEQLTLYPNADESLMMFAFDPKSGFFNYTTQASANFWTAGWTAIGMQLAAVAVTQDITPQLSE